MHHGFVEADAARVHAQTIKDAAADIEVHLQIAYF
jgi:hypothetical protein